MGVRIFEERHDYDCPVCDAHPTETVGVPFSMEWLVNNTPKPMSYMCMTCGAQWLPMKPGDTKVSIFEKDVRWRPSNPEVKSETEEDGR